MHRAGVNRILTDFSPSKHISRAHPVEYISRRRPVLAGTESGASPGSETEDPPWLQSIARVVKRGSKYHRRQYAKFLHGKTLYLRRKNAMAEEISARDRLYKLELKQKQVEAHQHVEEAKKKLASIAAALGKKTEPGTEENPS